MTSKGNFAMSKQKQAANSDYLSKELATKRSGRSFRRLQELAKAGKVRKRYVKDGDTNRFSVLFHAGDIERLAKTTSGEMRIAESMQNPINAALRRVVAQSDIMSLRQDEYPERGPITTQRPWLTIAEAAEYTGLPAKFLVALIEGGNLLALDVGNRKGGHWRVARRDLDGITGEKQMLAIDSPHQSQPVPDTEITVEHQRPAINSPHKSRSVTRKQTG